MVRAVARFPCRGLEGEQIRPGDPECRLQLAGCPAELLPYANQVEDLAPELTGWARTAAAMMQLDLIIPVDTSVAHLAGALGRPVWICLAADPEWRWMLDGLDTPWFSTARLFRQRRVGEWPALFAEVAHTLGHLVNAERASAQK